MTFVYIVAGALALLGVFGLVLFTQALLSWIAQHRKEPEE